MWNLELQCSNKGFSSNINYIYIQIILWQSCVIWRSTLTREDYDSLERLQKNALRNILKERYIKYENSFNIVQLEPKEERIYCKEIYTY